MSLRTTPATVITGETLDSAVRDGLITRTQAEALLALAIRSGDAPPRDDEALRFITGFGDIFVAIGLVLFLGATGFFGESLGGPLGMSAAVVVASWGLAEYFTRKLRMALPSIILLVSFACSVFMLAAAILSTLAGQAIADRWTAFDHPGMQALAALATAGATVLHYRRFQVPITIAAGVAALVGAVLALLASAGLLEAVLSPIVFACGLAVFALAMRYDLSDPDRLTRRTDIAFWLHMLAAPLIVHPLVQGLIGSSAGNETSSALGVLAIFALLAAIAVLVDRRAVLVSGLGYAGYAFGSLVQRTGLTDSVIPLTMLVLGGFVLLLSAGWHPLRRAIVARLPERLARRLPRTGTDDTPLRVEP